MAAGKTILFWIRDKHFIPADLFVSGSHPECGLFIPFICLDEREFSISSEDPACIISLRQLEWKTMQALRTRLKESGSNLLVLEGRYETLIPSIARVLKADEVQVSVTTGEPVQAIRPLEITTFRDEKLKESIHHLRMHSISAKVLEARVLTPNTYQVPKLSGFPEINPGVIFEQRASF